METNTVVLSLSDYNQLREFKEKMEEGNTYKLPQPFVYGGGSYITGESYPKTTYITTDSAVAELLERNTHLSALNEELMNECNRLRLEDRPYNSKLVNKLAKMSIWEFIKWRKEQ